MKLTTAKLDAFNSKWDRIAARAYAARDDVSAEVIWMLLNRLQAAVEQNRSLLKLVDRWRSTRMQPWVGMGRDLESLLIKPGRSLSGWS